MSARLVAEMNKRYVHQGINTIKIRDLFSRKQENIQVKDDKIFSKYWQVYAWCAIIGFINNKRDVGVDLPNQNSFEFERITNGSSIISYSLILMGISKIDSDNVDDILDAKKIHTIISEYAEGGARHILEIRATPGQEGRFNFTDDYFFELLDRLDDNSKNDDAK